MTPSDQESQQARIADLARQLSELRGAPAPQSMLVVTTLREGRILQASEGFALLSGYKREELIGRTTTELGLWRDAADRARAVKRLAAQGGRGRSHFVIRRHDGTPCEIVADMESIAIGGEQVVVTAIERTPAEHSPGSSREQEESLDFILGNAPLTFYTTDRNGVLTMSAGKALSRLGLKTGELVGKSVIDLYGPLPVMLADG